MAAMVYSLQEYDPGMYVRRRRSGRPTSSSGHPGPPVCKGLVEVVEFGPGGEPQHLAPVFVYCHLQTLGLGTGGIHATADVVHGGDYICHSEGGGGSVVAQKWADWLEIPCCFMLFQGSLTL